MKAIPTKIKYSYFGTNVVEKTIEIWLYDHYHDRNVKLNPAWSLVKFLTRPRRINPVKAMNMLENFEAWGVWMENRRGELDTRIMQLPSVRPRLR